MAAVHSNNASSRLAVALTAGATSLSVTSGEGSKYPSTTGGNWFPLTLIKASGALEIVRCTARSGDVFTVTRAQEGTSAQAFSVGDRVELRLTSAVLAEMQTATSTAQTTADNAGTAAAAAQASANAAQTAHNDFAVKKDAATSTGAAIIPNGTTAQRPGTPQAGMFRLNSTTGMLEVYVGGAWTPVPHDKWMSKGIGEVFAMFSHIVGWGSPPTNNANYRFIILTASSSYNAGVLTSETVTGSAPDVQATAVISDADSPMNGQTVRLINTERRFLRAGNAGAVEADAFKSHTHPVGNGTFGQLQGPTGTAVGGNVQGIYGSNGTSGFPVTATAVGDTETRVKNIGATYFMRIR